MGSMQSINKINYESIQYIVNNNNLRNYLLINTLDNNNQSCLIKNTILDAKVVIVN